MRERRPDLKVEGPIQYDAAVDAERRGLKLPDSQVAGQATVLVFPDLDTGNVAYKAVQRSSGAVAIGPVLQGLRKPVNDLSRGCSGHRHRQHGRDHRDPGAGGRRRSAGGGVVGVPAIGDEGPLGAMPVFPRWGWSSRRAVGANADRQRLVYATGFYLVIGDTIKLYLAAALLPTRGAWSALAGSSER